MIINKRIPYTYWFGLIKWELFTVTAFSTILYFVTMYVAIPAIPISIGAFLGTAISLLLSFQLSQSYDRWWEARKIWGEIVNDSRSFVIQVMRFSKGKDKALTNRMAFRQIGWCYSLAASLRKKTATEDIVQFVSPEELESIQVHKNIPLVLLDKQSIDLGKLHGESLINDFQQVQIDTMLRNLTTSMGKAERIKNTPFPKTYRKTLHLFIFIFLVTLSISLTELHNLVEIPVLVFIAAPFFLLEKIAFSLQDPFEDDPTDTAMTSISRTIEINIKQLLDREDLPEAVTSDTFYVL